MLRADGCVGESMMCLIVEAVKSDGMQWKAKMQRAHSKEAGKQKGNEEGSGQMEIAPSLDRGMGVFASATIRVKTLNRVSPKFIYPRPRPSLQGSSQPGPGPF